MSVMTATHGMKSHSGFHPIHWMGQALAIRHQRVHLEDLDDYMLADIGLDRLTAAREAHRPFWDIP